MFSLPYQWQDKPHRHVWDLCNEIDALNLQLQAMRDALKKIKEHEFCHNEMSDVQLEMADISELYRGGIYAHRRCASIAREGLEKIEKIGGKG